MRELQVTKRWPLNSGLSSFFFSRIVIKEINLLGTTNTGNTILLNLPVTKINISQFGFALNSRTLSYQIARNGGTRFVCEISIVLIVLASAKLNI